MFTGIIDEIGRINRIMRSSSQNSISISCYKITEDIKISDSIAVNGICLTVRSFQKDNFTADVMPVTFQKSNLKTCQINDPVNLERALQLKSRLGGHLVSGHIDGTGKILTIQKRENAFLFEIDINPELRKFLVPQGSVCLEGISLTIADLSSDKFIVSIIPETMKNTNLQYKSIGDMVNIETDLIGKYVHNFLQNNQKKGISLELLQENGFA